VTPLIGLSTVYCASKHTIGHIGDRFYGSNDPTSSVRALKEGVTALKKTPRTDRNHWSGLILSSSTTGVMTERAFLHLCQFYSASTVSHIQGSLPLTHAPQTKQKKKQSIEFSITLQIPNSPYCSRGHEQC